MNKHKNNDITLKALINNKEADTQQSELCKSTDSHTKLVQQVSKEMPSETDIYYLADFFKIMGDSTRIKILSALALSEMCVCAIAEVLGMSLSSVSHQLRILRAGKLVRSRKEGKQVYYSLDDDHVTQIFSQGFTHIKED